MKHTLKGWLADNAVTADNTTDKILLLESAGAMNKEDILEKMFAANTGLQPETLRHVVDLYHRIVLDALLEGMQVNTGLFYGVAKFVGVIDGGKWNPEKNSVYVSLTQGQELRQGIAETAVSILGEKANVMYILETEDRKTKLKDGRQEPLRARRDAQSHGRRPVGRRHPHERQGRSDEDRRRRHHHQQAVRTDPAPARLACGWRICTNRHYSIQQGERLPEIPPKRLHPNLDRRQTDLRRRR